MNFLQSLLSWFTGTPATPPAPVTPPITTRGHVHLDYAANHANEPLIIPTVQAPPAVQPVVATQATTTVTYTKASIINGVIDKEKGYVNHPADLGGETNFGITKATANSKKVKPILLQMGWDGTMINLTKPMAVRVYEIMYWDLQRLDDIFIISPFLADKLFDIGVNVGVTRGVKWLQNALNAFNRMGKDYPDLVADGGLGQITLDAIHGFIKARGKDKAVINLLRALVCSQGYHYLSISLELETQETFTFGWYDHRLPHNVKDYHIF